MKKDSSLIHSFETCIGGKLLVYTGIGQVYSGDRYQTAEVIDILHENMECQLLRNSNFSLHSLFHASGGRINDDFIFCGGHLDTIYIKAQDRCFSLLNATFTNPYGYGPYYP